MVEVGYGRVRIVPVGLEMVCSRLLRLGHTGEWICTGGKMDQSRIWLSGDKIYLFCHSKLSRSACGVWKLSNAPDM